MFKWHLRDHEKLMIYEHNVPREATVKDIIDRLKTANASSAAEADFRVGDMRFIACNSYMVICPNADPKLVRKYGKKVVARTSDVVNNPVEEELNSFAFKFAREYNSRKMELLLGVKGK
jgi:hypothetical protein